MPEVTLFMMTSLDGFVADEDNKLYWHQTDEAFHDFALSQLSEADALLLGRKTFDLFNSYWNTESARMQDPIMHERLTLKHKWVCSRRTTYTEWSNVSFIPDVLETLMHQKTPLPDKLLLLGSNQLATALLHAGLLTRIRLMINPMLLGSGHSLFYGKPYFRTLTLTQSYSFSNGNLLLEFVP
jgi:dihydrofolate reductase